MARIFANERTRSLLVPLIVLLVLALAAAGLWVISNLAAGEAISVDGAAETEGYRHVSSIYGSGADRLHRPTEVAIDADGNLYVADSFKHRIVVFDQNGAFLRTIGSPANVDGALKFPSAVEVDARGRIYVTSSEPDRIVIFGQDGRPIRAFEVPRPLTMAIAADKLYVATEKGILVGSLDGAQVGQLLSKGKKGGQIDRPTGMVVDAEGTIYLADSLNYRFQAVDKAGKPLWQLGTQPDAEKAVVDRSRQYGLPSGLELGSDGVLYGIDAFNGEIVAISREGEELGRFGAWGRQDGEFYYPTGIAQVDGERFAVADTFNDRVQIVGVPSPRPDIVGRSRRAFPWLFPALALFGLLALLRRPVLVAADAAALRRADERGMLEDVIGTAKRIYVPTGTAEALADLIEYDDRLLDVLNEVDIEDLQDDEDPMCRIALGLRGRLGLRRTAMAFPDTAQTGFAEEHGIGVLGPRTPAAETVTA